MTDLCNRVQ